MNSVAIFLDPLLMVLRIALDLYMWCIILGVVSTWLFRFGVLNAYNPRVYAISQFLHRISEPLLGPIRRFLPSIGGIDLSPVVGLLLLYFLKQLLENLQSALY